MSDFFFVMLLFHQLLCVCCLLLLLDKVLTSPYYYIQYTHGNKNRKEKSVLMCRIDDLRTSGIALHQFELETTLLLKKTPSYAQGRGHIALSEE